MRIRAKELRQMWKRKAEAHKAQAKAAGTGGEAKTATKSARTAKKSEA